MRKHWTERLKAIPLGEAGKVEAAIQQVARMGKPAAEVIGLRASRADVIHDLRLFLRHDLGTRNGQIHPWVHQLENGRVDCGFYSEPWTIQALEYAYQIEDDYFRNLIQGLVYGYDRKSIQQFLDCFYDRIGGRKPPRRATKSRA